MYTRLGRRGFLQMAGSGLATASISGFLRTSVSGASPRGVSIQKALKFGMFEEEGLSVLEKFRCLREAGFDGVEMDSPNSLDRDEIIEASRATGLPVPGVVDSVHWKKTLSDPDPAVRSEGVAGLMTAISDARALGASTVLLVPAVVNKDVSYEDAYNRSQQEIRRVLPYSQEQGVRIAIENVWNSFLLSPLEMARYIDEFESEWIGVHFDIGNILNYGWPEQWIRILGHRILKLDVKEFSREKRDNEGLWKGFDVKIGDGDCDWPAVVRALEDVGYSGWAAAEVPGGDRTRIREIAERMDRVLPTRKA